MRRAKQNHSTLDLATNEIISVRDVTVQFGSKKVLDGLNLDIHRGEILGFIGPSGAGKSVLMRTILGLNKEVSRSEERRVGKEGRTRGRPD